MCIIAAKPAGVQAPDRAALRNMWEGNSDGAGFMYALKGKVHIEKGFMKYTDFINAWEKLEKSVDTTKTPIVLHFRITTHGGTCPENCHPFPITDNIGALKKLRLSSDLGVAHNGVIPNNPRKGISDTMEYIATQLAPLKQALPRFYENKHAMLLVKNAIKSRMAFLTGDGSIYTIGDFIEDNGILYSNSSYKYTTRSYSWNSYPWEDIDWDKWEIGSAAGKTGKKKKAYTPPMKDLMWLHETDMVRLDGDLFEGYDFLIDANGTVYEYDYATDIAIRLPDATALTAEGTPVHFIPDESDFTYVED